LTQSVHVPGYPFKLGKQPAAENSIKLKLEDFASCGEPTNHR